MGSKKINIKNEKSAIIPIPAVFIRMRDAIELLGKTSSSSSPFNVVYMFSRYEPFMDPSTIFI
jgi:hypothetical protein